MKIDIYSISGKKESVEMPKSMFSDINLPLLAQSIRVYESRRHAGLSKVKTRSQINLTKAKVYKQKGTGGARHGAKSAPIFVGGGVAHGPKGIKKTLALSKKVIIYGKKIALTLKAKDGNLAFIDSLSTIDKTKKAQQLVNKAVNKRKNTKITILFSLINKDKMLFFKNLNGVRVLNYKNANSFDIHFGGYILIDKDFEKSETKTRNVNNNSKVEKIIEPKKTKISIETKKTDKNKKKNKK